MDKKTIAKMIVFVLVWVNAFLAQHHLKTIPLIDEKDVAMYLAFAYSAYEWAKHAYKWVKTNWVSKQADPVPTPLVATPDPTPTAVDTTVSIPTAIAQTVQSTTIPEQPAQQNVQQ